jgi:hypothetical protein
MMVALSGPWRFGIIMLTVGNGDWFAGASTSEVFSMSDTSWTTWPWSSWIDEIIFKSVFTPFEYGSGVAFF